MLTQQEDCIDTTLTELRDIGVQFPEFRPVQADQEEMDSELYTVGPDEVVRISPKTGESKLSIVKTAKYLCDCGFRYYDGRFYRFDGRHFELCTKDDVDDFVSEAVRKVNGSNWPEVRSDHFTNIRKFFTTLAKPDKIYDIQGGLSTEELESRYDGWMVPFENGIYSLLHDELLPFTPSIFFDRHIHARYMPDEDNPQLESLYLNIFGDRETLEFFYLAIGYTLYSETLNPPAIFLLLGGGETGKSAVLHVLESLLGSSYVSNESLSKLSTPFGLARLRGMAANICNESGNTSRFSTAHPIDGDLLKAISAGNPWDSEAKFQDICKFQNKAKLWFASNNMPDFGDTSSGMIRRLYIFPCKIKQDPSIKLYNLLTSPEGKAWLAFKALKTFIRFKWEGGGEFRESRKMLYQKEMFSEQDPVREFLNETLSASDAESVRHALDKVSVSDLYSEFRTFQIDSGKSVMLSRKGFKNKILTEYGLECRKFNTRSFGKESSVMKFVIPKEESQDDEHVGLRSNQ